jgi:adenylate cyclase
MERRAGLEGELRNVCVLFLDIRNFTQYSEKRTPQEVVDYLNGLFTFMIDIVSKHNGIINKFLGDGFMAIFGAPLADGRECEHAMRAALEIVARLQAEVAAGKLPPTRTGIGIHYGPALTGSIGSPRRKEYTIIGDTVNLASRIEHLTKDHDAQILVSQSVLHAAPEANIPADRIGEVAVRGRQARLELYRLA